MNYFSTIGYLSVLLGLTVPVLWFLYFTQRVGTTPARQGGLQRWSCLVALGVALVAAILAKVNSVTYVNRIQLDQSAEIQAVQAKLDAARKLAEKSRGGEVAQVRFAEDSSGDFMDEGGMDSADLKYMEKIRQEGEPEWKKAKKSRAAGGQNRLSNLLRSQRYGVFRTKVAVWTEYRINILLNEMPGDLLSLIYIAEEALVVQPFKVYDLQPGRKLFYLFEDQYFVFEGILA